MIPCDDRVYEDAVLTGECLEGMDFRESRFFQITLTGSNLKMADFAGSTFDHASFLACDFSRATFHGSHFKDCTFEGCKMEAVDYSRCIFTHTTWKETNMRYAIMENAVLKKGCSFLKYNMEEMTLCHMKLAKTLWETCNLQRANLTGTSFSEQNLAGSSLGHISLSCDYHELRGMEVDIATAADIATLLGVILR